MNKDAIKAGLDSHEGVGAKWNALSLSVKEDYNERAVNMSHYNVIETTTS